LANNGWRQSAGANGKLWTMQYIREDGTKRFAKNSRKEGCFHVVGGIRALVKSPVLVISEGYATAATLSQTLGFATVAAFDSGNLVSVAKALHAKYPQKQIVIAGDDDKHLELTHGINPGRSKAEEAARAVGGKVILPIFAPNENSYPAGLEPVTPQMFRKGQLSDQQHTALAKMKQYTDFNDVATKSVLGSEGVERQVRSVLDSLQHARVALAIARSERSVPRRKRLQLG
jgi:putative DNA primase/helicase